VIANFDDINTNTFNFQDMELLDATLAVLERGAGIDFLTRERACFIHFTLTVNPRLLNTHAIEIEPQTFPSQTSLTVHV
jgi:hypothetical protein